MQQRFDSRREEEIETMMQQLEEERSAYAALQAEQLRQVSILGEVEQKQWQVVAERYSAMRRPWDLMRELPVEDIAHILLFMDGKKSAKVLDVAIADQLRPELPLQIHQRLMSMDTDGLSGNQAQRLASLYQYMKPAQVLPYLEQSSTDEIAQIIQAMPDKNQAGLLEFMQQEDPLRAQEVQLRLKEMTLAGGGP